VKRPNNEHELIAVIRSIIDANPQRHVGVAAIGDRVQALTKCAWNKTFKPQFGNLKDFLLKRASEFYVDNTLDRVFLKQDWDNLTAQKAQQNAQLSAKKAAKKDRSKASDSAPSSSSGKKGKGSGNHSGSQQQADESSSPILKIVAVLGLAAALVFLTALAVSGGDLAAITSRVRAHFQ